MTYAVSVGAGAGSGCGCIATQARQLSAVEQQRLQDLAGVVMQLLDLRLALQQQPTSTAGIWIALYDHLDTSLVRLDTLAELSRWEASDTTPSALGYRQSREEEAALVTQKLAQQVAQALASVR